MNTETRPLIWRLYRPAMSPKWSRWCAAYADDRNRVVIDVGSEEALVAAMKLLSGLCELNKSEVSSG